MRPTGAEHDVRLTAVFRRVRRDCTIDASAKNSERSMRCAAPFRLMTPGAVWYSQRLEIDFAIYLTAGGSRLEQLEMLHTLTNLAKLKLGDVPGES